MWNTIRMDVYKMFHMRSFWVIALLVLFFTYLATTVVKSDLTIAMPGNGEKTRSEQSVGEDQTDHISLTYAGQLDTVSVLELFCEDFTSMFCTLFMVIFAVLFTSADLSSGYIKNIGGQVRHRSNLIVSKSVSLFLYTILFMLYIFVIQAISCAMVFGRLQWGAWKEYLPFLGMELFLQFVFLIICMTVTMVTRSKVFSMSAAVCLCMGISSMICMLLDKLAKQYLNWEITLEDYLITTKIGTILPGFTKNQARDAILVAAAFFVIMTVINVISTEKRDLV